MSDDDSKPARDKFFTPSGKFKKGHPGLRRKQEQPNGPPDNPPDDAPDS